MIKNKFCVVGIDKDIEEYLQENKLNYVGLISDFKNKNYKIGKRIGNETLKSWKKIKKKYNPDVFILIDDGKQREKLVKKIFKKNVKNLIYKETYINKSVYKEILKKKALVIQKLCMISSNVKLGDGIKINIGSQIHHDVKVGEYSTIAPRAVILGSVKIGRNCYIGANSVIKQGITIGNNAIIGAGSTVVKNVKRFEIVVGNPAKKINSQ